MPLDPPLFPSLPSPRHFADKREFRLIESLFGADHFSRDAEGIGDDACFFPREDGLVVSHDLSLERTHYRLDWVTPAEALEKALLSNLSDINAMGGKTHSVLLGLGMGQDWAEETLAGLARVIRSLEEAHGFRVKGGDTVSAPGGSLFAVTVLGRVKGRPLLRSGARAGQRLFVSGALGGSAAGLYFLERFGAAAREDERMKSLVEAHLRPRPPLRLGPFLSGLSGAGAAIDLSDGLSSELGHLARRSRVKLVVREEGLSRASALLEGVLPPDLEPSRAQKRDFVLHGGEDYQLLFTGDFEAGEIEAMREICPVTEIGQVEGGEGVFLRSAGPDEAERPLPPGGYGH